MLKVLLGKISAAHLVKELAALPNDHVERLYDCVKNNTFRYRARALAMLAHKKGVRNVTITRFLRVGPQYLARIKSAYQTRGIDWFSKHGHKGLRRYEMEPHKKAVFTILHTPPSAYGINRTTWTIKLIGEVMSKQGMRIGKNDLGKIIRNAGYRFCKAKSVF
jgi:transposase